MQKENLLCVLLPIWIIFMFVSIGYGTHLQARYARPYRLLGATTGEKWKWALQSSFFIVLPFLMMGLMFPILTPDKNVEWWDSLVCGGFSLLLLPVLVVARMVNFAISGRNFEYLGSAINKAKNKNFKFPFFNTFILDKETKQFFQEGIPDDFPKGEERDLFSLQKEKAIYQSTSPDSEWELNIYRPTYKSPLFYAYFKNLYKPEEYLAPFGYFSSVDHLSVNWGLPNQTCGLYLENQCYLLFYYGKQSRSIGRIRARRKKDKPFSSKVIDWFINLS